MKMKWNRIVALIFVAFTLIVGSMAHSGRTEAAKPPFFEHLYLLKSVKTYDSRTAKKASGTLPADLVLTVVDSDVNDFFIDSPKWYLVKTAKGNKWIKDDYTTMNTGMYSKQDRMVTSVFTMELFNRPGGPGTTYKIAPQKLHVTAAFQYAPASPSNATSLLLASEDIWYQIDTWLGKKWIHEPALLEDVKPKEVSYSVKLTGQETTYPNPFVVETDAQTLEPQVVQVTGQWTAGIGPWEVNWIRIRLDERERWLSPQNVVLDSYAEYNESVVLQTETRYFEKLPRVYEAQDKWLPPGTYEAFEASGDFVHIHSSVGDVWVNPTRALLERPLGIEPTDEKIQLTKESRYYRFPNTGEITHLKGFYAPQFVKAFEKWKSEDGGTYYHFHSFAGDEWVLVP